MRCRADAARCPNARYPRFVRGLSASTTRIFRSCDSAHTDELGPRGSVTTGVTANRDRWRHLIQSPARSFVSARRTAQRDPLMFEVQQTVVPVKTAVHLT